MSGFLQTAFDWLPALLRNQAHTSLRKFHGGNDYDGPFGWFPQEHWIDVKDLFLYGEHFTNYKLNPGDTGHTSSNGVKFDYGAGSHVHQMTYASVQDALNLFKDPDKCFVRQDGIVRLSIKGALMDTTP